MSEFSFNADKCEKYLSIGVLLPYLLLVIQTIISNFIELEVAQLISKTIVGFYFIFLYTKYKNLLPSFCIVALFFSCLFFLDGIIHIENGIYRINIFSYFITTCLPIFIVTKRIKNWTIFLDCSKKISYLLISLGAILFYLRIKGYTLSNEYNMSFGYYLLLPTVCALYFYFNKINTEVSLVFFCLGCIEILLLGSRGPILGVILFWGLYELFFSRIKTLRRFLFRGIIILIFFICYLNFNTIILFLSQIVKSLGIESRTLQYVLDGEISNLSNRDIIYSWALQQIGDSSILGNGIGYSFAIRGTHCHNIILEIFLEFGIILATVIIILFVGLCLYKLYKSNELERKIILIWFCVGVVPLLISSIYWEYMQFWTFVGVVFASGRKTPIKSFIK